MIIMGGFLKGKAVVFAVLGVVFVALSFTMSSLVRPTFLIIGISWLAAAGLSLWMAKASEPPAEPPQPGTGHWVG